jgi:hypothetical protein
VTVTASTAVVTASTTEATISVSGNDAATVTVAGAVAPNPIAQRYSPVFQATGLTFTGSGATYPTYNSWFVKHGQFVTFQIEVLCTTVTNFGTGQYKLQLPVMPLGGSNHFSGWIWRDPSIPADDENHIILNVDTVGVTDVLDLHFLIGATPQPKAVVEKILKQGAPGYNLTTVSKMYVNGTYIGES